MKLLKIPPIVTYLDTIARINDLPISTPGEWFFYQGMLFLSKKKWWADFGTRHANHEGIDIGLFKNRYGKIEWLDTSTRVPAMAEGEIVNVCPDLLGHTVVIKHCSNRVSREVSVYSHLSVPSFIVPGKTVRQGEIIGNIADTTKNKSGLHCHLHLSLMEISNLIPDKDINWQVMGNPDNKMVKLFNPMV